MATRVYVKLFIIDDNETGHLIVCLNATSLYYYYYTLGKPT